MSFWLGYISRVSAFVAVVAPIIFVSWNLYRYWLKRWGLRTSAARRRWTAAIVLMISWLPLGLFALWGVIKGIYHSTPVSDRILIVTLIPIAIGWLVGVWIFESSFPKSAVHK